MVNELEPSKPQLPLMSNDKAQILPQSGIPLDFFNFGAGQMTKLMF